MKWRGLWGVVLAVSSMAWSRAPAFAAVPAKGDPVTAADKATARGLAQRAVADHAAGRHAEALEKMQRAQAIFEAPTHLLVIARCQVALGRLVEASETYRTLQRFELGASPPPAWTKAVSEAGPELEKLTPDIPKLRILIDPASATDIALTIDDQPVPAAVIGADRPTDPGHHRIRATSPSGEAEVAIDVARGETKSVTLELRGEGTPARAGAGAAGAGEATAGRARSLPHRHDGWLLRLGVGAGRLEDRFEVRLLGIPGLGAVEGTATGASASFELALGIALRPGLHLGGALLVEQVASPKIEVNGVSSDTVSVGTLAVVGPMIDWYPDAEGGFHVGAAVGVARIDIKDSGGNLQESSPVGGAIGVGVGYEIFIADEWSLGVLGRFIAGTMSANSVTHKVTVPALLVEGTYN